MKDFTEFEAWLEESGTSRKIGEMASGAVMEYVQAGKADCLTAEQQDAMFNFAIRVSSQVTAGLLQEYHQWAGGQNAQGK